ncbi:MAG: FecR domain-containing protein [Verrucomicrobia bacterium]|nr:FecR domain-containing protein [Verrucomicrobiota bacterium]
MKRPIPLAEQAADWLIRRDRGLSSAEQDEFLQWLAADPRHGDAFTREQQTWRELDLLADWRPEHATEPNPDLLARPTARGKSRLFWLAPLAVAAAAAVVFLLTVARRPTPATSPAVAAVASTYEHRVLEDGSIAELNRGAAIVLAFTVHERRVRLVSGEVHFTVVNDAARPFVVHARGVEARAVGTAFHVRLGSAAVEVLVIEGRVQVEQLAPTDTAANPAAARAAIPIVAAGERVVVPLTPASAPRITSVSADEIARILAWQPRLLELSAAPLADVVAEFNRRNAVQLVIAEPALETVPIVASFRSDNVEGFVRLLEVTADIHAVRQGDTISLRQKRSP